MRKKKNKMFAGLGVLSIAVIAGVIQINSFDRALEHRALAYEENVESESNDTLYENDMEETYNEWMTEMETESESESENESEYKIENQPESGTEHMPESGNENEPEGETENEPESGNENEPESGTENIPEDGTTSESEVENESELTGENESKPHPEETASIETEFKETEPKSESKPQKIQRGRDYEIKGDPNAWFRDEHDLLWVRAGSGLHVLPNGQSGELDGGSIEHLQSDGVLTFSLRKTDANGAIIAESEVKQESYYVDGEAPTANISIAGESYNGVIYLSDFASADISIPPDGKSGLKEARYAVLNCETDGTLAEAPESAVWNSCESQQRLSISDEGMYQIYVRTEDRVGNQTFAKSGVVCIDKSAPEIRISGVKDQTANSGELKIKVKSSDPHFAKGSMHVSFTGINEGKVPTAIKNEESAEGAQTEYLDFPREKHFDDIYQMKVEASDLAGNMTEKMIQFSVNRFGSVYDLAADTKEQLRSFYWNKAQDIIFYETNIDYVGESKIFCRRDGELTELIRKKDYQVTLKGSDKSWKQYQYKIPASYFSKEGVYELLLSSSDRASNESDTGIQKKRVSFVLDQTAPDCFINGIEKEKVYQEKQITALLTPTDNHGIRIMRIYRNSELLLEKQSFSKDTESIKLVLDEADEWQTIQIYLCDLAGNEYWSEEIPVYVHSEKGAVPEYRRERASARELMEYEKQTAKDAGKKMLNANKRKNSDNQVQKERRVEMEPETGKLFFSRNMEGRIIFILGGLMFFVTGISCLWSGRRRK